MAAIVAPKAGPSRLPAREVLLSGAVSGLSSCVVLQPLDLLKTRLQQGETHDGQARGRLLRTVRQVVKNDGPLGLWRGTAPTVARNVPGVALYMFSVTTLRRLAAQTSFARTVIPGAAASSSASPRLKVVGDMLVGATARTAVGFALMPVTVIKARAESSYFGSEGIVASGRALLREGGVRALWRGFVPTTLRDAPTAGLFIVFYERAKSLLERAGLGGGLRDSLSGACGATMSTLITAPFDTLKTKRQLKPALYPSMIVGVQRIYASKGLLGFMDGVSLRMFRKAGSSAIAWSTYESLLRLFTRRQNRTAV